MITFGLIAEGRTDHKVLKNILIGFFNDRAGEKISITENQPLEDATDIADRGHHGSWTQVIKYLSSDDFSLGLEFADYYIIQFDTDVAHNLNVETEDDLGAYIQKVKAKLIVNIDPEVYKEHQDKIIFAISVNSIECWLLPLYFTNNTAAKTNNCLFKLNQQLPTNLKISANKSPNDYIEISSDYARHRILKREYSRNPSLDYFISILNHKFPIFTI